MTNSPPGHSFSDFVHAFGVSVVVDVLVVGTVDDADIVNVLVVGTFVDAVTVIVAAVDVVVVTDDGRLQGSNLHLVLGFLLTKVGWVLSSIGMETVLVVSFVGLMSMYRWSIQS